MAYGILAWQILARIGLVDDSDSRRSNRILFIEKAAAHHGDTERFIESRGCQTAIRHLLFAMIDTRRDGHHHLRAQWENRTQPSVPDTGNRTKALKKRLVRGSEYVGAARRRTIAAALAGVEDDPASQHVLLCEAERDLA